MESRVPESEEVESDRPIIARIADGPWVGTLRQKAATLLRRWAAALDPSHTIVIVTTDRVLMRHAIDGCVKLMWQKQAMDLYEANKDYLMACELQNWKPDEGRPQ